MRYCNQCHRLTAGEPLYCNFCGSSFNVKLCQARHINPRSAEVCAECGSRDLSTPAPRAQFWLAPMLFLLSLFPGVILTLLLVMVLVGILNAILTNQQVQMQLIVLLLILALLWFAYIHLPGFIRNLFKTVWHRLRSNRRQH
jgi:RNA polymerase subunit RPABC4/transcription elongation factor Spt4